MSKAGRKRIVVDEETLAKLARIHCTDKEISYVLGISVDTLTRRFSDLLEKNRAEGKMSLRRALWEAALVKKSEGMMKWLSIQHLGMTDKVEEKVVEKKSEVKIYKIGWADEDDSGGSSEEN